MQIFLHLNGANVGPFTLPRVTAKLVSGEVPPETLAWRDGLDNWYPLHHEIWEEVGIKTQVAPERPAPKSKVRPLLNPKIPLRWKV